jgi:regulation of enolase protein 1 (concanavalin A-like superfamily)
MNYELKDTIWVGAPKVKATDPTKVEVYVNVTTGIVGQTYTGFQNVDTVLMDFPISMTGADMQTSTTTKANAYIATKYPNT